MASTTPLSEAEKRTVKLVNIHGDPIKYSGNPAELAGARHEADLCMGRLGSFKMLIKHNAARLSTGSIAVEDLDTIPFVTKELRDPNLDFYTYENPCPSTTLRRARYNIAAAASGTPRHSGIASLSAVPSSVLKSVTLAPYEVELEDHAYALTQLSIFEDRKHANELLQACDLSGRKLRALLDDIENTATGEDLSLVTGRRNLVVQSGLKGRELTEETYKLSIARGEPWPTATKKEFSNHSNNQSWDFIPRSEVPKGRRIHKFVWVFKEKRDGTAKARLCVQGCTLEEGVDYDQTFAKPLRHTSARGLFAYAARNGCPVRSIDFVAAYLQGEFIDGEVVYCHQPAVTCSGFASIGGPSRYGPPRATAQTGGSAPRSQSP